MTREHPSSKPWKERFRTPEITYARIAHQNPERGFIIANIDETYQLHAWDIDKKETHPVTNLPGGVGFAAILSDGSGMIYHHDEAGEEVGHYFFVSFDGSHIQDLTPDLPEYSRGGWATSSGSNQIAMGAGLEDGFATFVLEGIPLDGAMPIDPLYKTEEISGWPELSQDGRFVVLHTAEYTKGARFSLVVLDIAKKKEMSSLTDGESYSIECVGFSPANDDYRILACTDRSGYFRPVIWDPLTDIRKDIELPDIEGDVRPLGWAPDASEVLLMQIFRAEQTIYIYNLENDVLQILETPPGSLGYYGGVYGFEVFYLPDGRLFALLQDAQSPGRIVELSPSTGKQIDTVLYLQKSPQGHDWESIEFNSTQETVIQGWLAKPTIGEAPFPTIIHTHGGPEAVMTNTFNPSSQAWLDHGYAFITLNYRGSTTFGKEFKECIWGQPGTYEVEDIKAARTWLIDQGIADSGKIFLTGYSYGGYLTLLAMGKAPGLWAGGLALAAVSDWVMSHELENPTLKAYSIELFLGSPEEKPDAWDAASPISYAGAFDAPVLIVQGSNDSRTPAEPIRVFEKKLKELGKDIQVHWYEAGHIGPTTEQWIEFQQLMLDFANAQLN